MTGAKHFAIYADDIQFGDYREIIEIRNLVGVTVGEAVAPGTDHRISPTSSRGTVSP